MQQACAAAPLLQNAKHATAFGHQMKQSEVRHVPAQNVRGATDAVRYGGVADLVAFTDQAHAERCIVTNAYFGHFQVALLEYPQRQHAARKQHCAQWKDRNLARTQAEPAFSGGSLGGADAPQRSIKVCGTRSWSSTRATTKSTKSSTLAGR